MGREQGAQFGAEPFTHCTGGLWRLEWSVDRQWAPPGQGLPRCPPLSPKCGNKESFSAPLSHLQEREKQVDLTSVDSPGGYWDGKERQGSTLGTGVRIAIVPVSGQFMKDGTDQNGGSEPR